MDVVSFIESWKPEVWTAIGTLVIAAFTIILGLFTVSLARSTRIAAEASDRSARALIAIELPIIRVSTSQASFYETLEPSGKRREGYSTNGFAFLNRGRSKAFPVELRYGWFVGPKLPETPVYIGTKPSKPDAVLYPEADSWSFIGLDDCSIDFSPGDREKIESGEFKAWVYCCLGYLDFMEERHDAGFCWTCVQEPPPNTAHYELHIDATAVYNRKT